jgi:hypothetical protein
MERRDGANRRIRAGLAIAHESSGRVRGSERINGHATERCASRFSPSVLPSAFLQSVGHFKSIGLAQRTGF